MANSERAAFPRTASAGAWTVFKRELRHYLSTPGTYVAIAFFLLLAGAFFNLILGEFVEKSAKLLAGEQPAKNEVPLNVTQQVVTQIFLALNFLMLVLAPLLTMRLISDEKKTGTFELLVTTPLSDWHILLGKYFAALSVGALILACCGAYPAIVFIYSRPEPAVVASCFAGLFLIMVAYLAFGLFASSLTESQIAAAVLSFVGLLIFHMVGWLFKTGTAGVVASALSLHRHSEGFTKGVFELTDVAYFILFAAFFLFLSAQVLDARRWRA